METTINTQMRRTPWNKGRLIGQRPPLKQKEVWAIRIRLQLAHEVRDLALFNLAIDSKLRGCDLVKLESAQNRGRLRSRAYRPILAGLSTDRELAMKLIIEARLEDDGVELTNIPIPVAVIHRHNDDLEQLGLSLAEGRELLAATQSATRI